MLVFGARGKPLRAEKRTNKLNPHMMSDPGIGHHMWATLVEGHHCANTVIGLLNMIPQDRSERAK